jgi:electron transfer flavoprotein beta subunit
VNVLVCLEPPVAGRASRAALDLACTLAAGAKVVAVCAGGQTTSASLELARRHAAVARVIHLDDPSLDQADFFTLGMVLAETARHLEASLVIAGERSDVEGQGLVPAALAHHLKAQLISRVGTVRHSAADGTVEVTTRAGGCVCTVACPLPLVLVTSALGGPGGSTTNVSARDPIGVETLALAQLGLDASRLVPRPDLLGALASPPAGKLGEMSLAETSAALLRHR